MSSERFPCGLDVKLAYQYSVLNVYRNCFSNKSHYSQLLVVLIGLFLVLCKIGCGFHMMKVEIMVVNIYMAVSKHLSAYIRYVTLSSLKKIMTDCLKVVDLKPESQGQLQPIQI